MPGVCCRGCSADKVAGPLWTPSSDNPSEGLREASQEILRLRQLTPRIRAEARVREAKRHLEDVKRDAESNERLLLSQQESALRRSIRADTAFLEGSKVQAELYKTRATLAIGSIAGVAAVTGFVSPSLSYPLLFVSSVVLLIACMVVSLSTINYLANNIYKVLGVDTEEELEEIEEDSAGNFRGWRDALPCRPGPSWEESVPSHCSPC